MPIESATLAVYVAINNVQKALAKKGVAKDSQNTEQRYAFRGIDAIYNALSSLMAEQSLCILPRVVNRTVAERTSKHGNALFYVVCDVEFDFVSSKDGSRHTVKMCGEAMDSGDKATNKAMSAAYKYCCLQTFCIPTEGDNDADSTTHEVKTREDEIPMDDPPVALPTAWNTWTLNEKGSNRAHAGTAALNHWWKQLPVDAKKILKGTLDKEWKPIAEAKDKSAA